MYNARGALHSEAWGISLLSVAFELKIDQMLKAKMTSLSLYLLDYKHYMQLVSNPAATTRRKRFCVLKIVFTVRMPRIRDIQLPIMFLRCSRVALAGRDSKIISIVSKNSKI